MVGIAVLYGQELHCFCSRITNALGRIRRRKSPILICLDSARKTIEGVSNMTTIQSMRVIDVRFPTSQRLDGSDAMNPDPDYSAAYVILPTDSPGLEGHGLTFTIGRGNEICCAAIRAMEHLVVGLDLGWIAEDMGRFWRHVTSDSQ